MTEKLKGYIYAKVGYCLNPPVEGFHWFIQRGGTHAEQGGPNRIAGYGQTWFKSFEDACNHLRDVAMYYKDDEAIPGWVEETFKEREENEQT